MRRSIQLLVAVAVALVPALQARAQGEEALRTALVGREVEVLIDMPATSAGIDYYPERSPRIDFNEYRDRLAEYGIAIRDGSVARITEVKVKGRHIEFQLDGGGYGTFGDESVPSTYVAMPPKTQRERDLEQELRNETDFAERQRIQRELDRLEDERERRYRRDKEDAEYRAEQARRRIERARLLKGSRFNVRYDRDVPVQIQTPEGLLAVLSEYIRDPASAQADVSFPGAPDDTGGTGDTGAPDDTVESDDAQQGSWPLPIWKGMTETDVAAVFGPPASRSVGLEGKLETVTCRYELLEADVEATFVLGALVRYSIVSR